MSDHKGLPVAGYKTHQTDADVALVNEGKMLEERVIQYIESLQALGARFDQRFIATGMTDIQKGFMCVFRGVFQPQRINLVDPKDSATHINECARQAHELNRHICLANSEDNVLPNWDECGEDIRKSARHGVHVLLQKPNMTPEDQHNEWSSFKRAEGWVYGIEKNADLKTHPCLVPYTSLPAMQRVKDDAFQAIVRSYFKL